jgi:hypothetical protein
MKKLKARFVLGTLLIASVPLMTGRYAYSRPPTIKKGGAND